MRVRSFEVKNVGPLQLVSVADLSNVVVLAGPNGVGKTQIDNALLQLARNPTPSPIWMTVEATNDEERKRWGKGLLDTRQAHDAATLRTYLQRNQKRNRYQGSFLNFDSDRAIRNVQQYGFSWNIGDPLAEDLGWNVGFEPLQSRYNDVRHSLFRIVEAQRREIADRALAAQQAGAQQLDLNFPDVIKPFKDAFWQLLAPKRLLTVSTQDQQIYYELNGTKLSVDTLSSGEKEVVNIVFDFLLRDPRHCVVIFDEPELHLHPELSYKLLQTLASIGTSNQFIFSTHSPDIISASLENTVVFITPPQDADTNQAIVVHRDDATHHALQALGQSIGVISLGKKLVLIEGDETSLDKQTYGAILQSSFPEFVLVPVGGKGILRSFDEVRDSILNKTIWGVAFYLLCDRDAVNLLGPAALAQSSVHKNIKQLPRYHLENYFLDEGVLAVGFASIEPPTSRLCTPANIKAKLLEIAASVVPYATALNVAASIREKVGNVSLMPKGAGDPQTPQELAAKLLARLRDESARITQGLDPRQVESLVIAEYGRLHQAVADDNPVWRADLPGRLILNKFAGEAKLQVGRIKQLYLANADKSRTFADVFDIFSQFKDGR
jgi:energy-coupling factor transporter ATP-binding protein EcfA2